MDPTLFDRHSRHLLSGRIAKNAVKPKKWTIKSVGREMLFLREKVRFLTPWTLFAIVHPKRVSVRKSFVFRYL